MINQLNNLNTPNTTNNSKKLAPKIAKLGFVLSTCISLILSNNSYWNEKKWFEEQHKYTDKSELFYNTLKNEMLFSTYWFVKATNIVNPNTITDSNLVKHEKTIIKAANNKIKNNIEVFSLQLSPKNINTLDNAGLIESISYLLDSMYWEWYSGILTDWNDHSNMELIIDIMENGKTHILREIRIWDYSEYEEEKDNNKDSVEKISNNKIYKV